MKQSLNLPVALICLVLVAAISCKKTDKDQPMTDSFPQTKTFSSEVALKWHDLHLRVLNISGSNAFGLNGNRYFAYSGIGLYESVVPGMPGYRSLHGQLSDMPAMPSIEPGKEYHWATSANALLAFLTKNFYTLASADHKAAMDSLENALKSQLQQATSQEVYLRSENFGRQVAQLIFDWSKTDGALTAWPAYVPSTDPSKWTPTAPNPLTVNSPYWGNNRLFVRGSTDNTASPPPPPYSTDPKSEYYKMVKEVYDVSQALTPEQRATALYFRDNPGFQAGTHYQYIFNQVMHDQDLKLDLYAVAQAKVGIAMAESQINCWKIKYDLVVDRPTRYIRDVLGYTNWTSVLSMPNHPDYPSGHSQTGGAFSAMMTSLFGDNYAITLHTYDHLDMARRPYRSFDEMAVDIGLSRVYAGIHYTYSCVEGKRQGEKIAQNILAKLNFKP